MTEVSHRPPEPRSAWRSLTLALVVHLALFLFLWIGVRWQNETPLVVEAEIWDPQIKEAAPLPDPRAKRDQIVLEGDIPSPMAPPPSTTSDPGTDSVAMACRLVQNGVSARPGTGGSHGRAPVATTTTSTRPTGTTTTTLQPTLFVMDSDNLTVRDRITMQENLVRA